MIRAYLATSTVIFSLGTVMAEITGIMSKSLKTGDTLPEPSGSMRLFVMRFCPWCERTLIYMAKKNISAEIVNVNLNEKPAFLLKKHSQGKVPVLEHDGKIITDSALISEYLDWIYPESTVLPSDPFLRAQQRMIANQLQDVMTAAYYIIIESQRNENQNQRKFALLNNALSVAEATLNNTFFGGETAGFADYMTYPFVERIWIWTHKDGVTDLDINNFPGKKYPKLTKWFNAMKNSEEVKEVAQPLQSHILFNEGYLKGTINYDAGL